jgi:hypothetical protein
MNKYENLANFLLIEEEAREEQIRVKQAQKDAKKDLANENIQLLIKKWRS